MKRNRLKTALIGFGRIAQGYAKDSVMASHFRYATHAQVLSQHPQFDWRAVVDPSATALKEAHSHWKVQETAASPEKLSCVDDIEVAVIATPPEGRLQILDAFPNLRAVIVEKPLAMDLQTAINFAETCRKRKILVQVNFMRRADRLTRKLAGGEMTNLIGTPQAVFGIYGNGLSNNGAHMIDLARMLIGEIESVQAIDGKSFVEGPLAGDINLPFNLTLKDKITVSMQPAKFSHYRENCLDIWGEKGRLDYMHGGATILAYPCKKNRLITGEHEIVVDKPRALTSTLGTAIYNIYTNTAIALTDIEDLVSPAESALKTASVIEAILQSAQDNGKQIRPTDLLKKTALVGTRLAEPVYLG